MFEEHQALNKTSVRAGMVPSVSSRDPVSFDFDSVYLDYYHEDVFDIWGSNPDV